MIGRAIAHLARRLSNMLALGLIAMVRLYQALLSPWLGRQCRFVPTCSHYFIEAVQKRGPLKGSLMGLWRILRCNPFSKGGYDPVDGVPGRRHPGR
jgi:putative membrane protein insertion efficiency factor